MSDEKTTEKAPAAPKAKAGGGAPVAGTANYPKYDPKAKGLDYGGDDVGAGNLPELDAKASERGYIGTAPGAEKDGDLTVGGVATRDVEADRG